MAVYCNLITVFSLILLILFIQETESNLFVGNQYSTSRYVGRTNTSNSYSGSIIELDRCVSSYGFITSTCKKGEEIFRAKEIPLTHVCHVLDLIEIERNLRQAKNFSLRSLYLTCYYLKILFYSKGLFYIFTFTST